MVENDIAILFKRVDKKDGFQEFIPISAVVGYIDNKCDDLFLDINTDIVYHHISDVIEIGICFGFRTPISSLVGDIDDVDMQEVLDNYLSKYKDYIFYRDINTSYKIYMFNKDDCASLCVMRDIDSADIDNVCADDMESNSGFTKNSNKGHDMYLYDDMIDTDDKNMGVNKTGIVPVDNTSSHSSSSNIGFRRVLINKTPLELVNCIKEYVKGQDDAIKLIVTNLYQRYNFENGSRTNMFVVGPSGCGKTYIFDVIGKFINVPVFIYSIPGLSEAGYIGNSVDDILLQLYIRCNYDLNKVYNSIVILDEIDKLSPSSKNGCEKGGIATVAVQDELLEIIQGTERMIKVANKNAVERVIIDTSKIQFILVGAFDEIFDESKNIRIGFNNECDNSDGIREISHLDIVKYGLKREFVRRAPLICTIRSLTIEDLYNIVISPNGELIRMVNLFKEIGIEFLNYTDIAYMIAKNAYDAKIGASGIFGVVSRIFSNVLYDAFNNIGEYAYLTLGENILNNSKDYVLSKKMISNSSHVKRLVSGCK